MTLHARKHTVLGKDEVFRIALSNGEARKILSCLHRGRPRWLARHSYARVGPGQMLRLTYVPIQIYRWHVRSLVQVQARTVLGPGTSYTLIYVRARYGNGIPLRSAAMVMGYPYRTSIVAFSPLLHILFRLRTFDGKIPIRNSCKVSAQRST